MTHSIHHVPASDEPASAAHLRLVALLSNRRAHALFLDVDGTLIDIAPTPEAVHVPDALPALISGLAQRLHGAVALISGRPIAQIDALLTPLVLPCAGVHGAQWRLEVDGPIVAVDGHESVPSALVAEAAAIAALDPRLLLEHKPHSLALHYRAVPEMAAAIRVRVDELVNRYPGVELLAGKMVFELKTLGFDKGLAVERFMQQPPFAGRTPIMIGDDITDEAAFTQVRSMSGAFFTVGQTIAGAEGRFNNPGAVRLALADVLGIAIASAESVR